MWLKHLRPEIKKTVVRLIVRLRVPRESDISNIACGLAGFRAIQVELPRLGDIDVSTRVKVQPLIGKLCHAIASKRSGQHQTLWHDAGDVEGASTLREYLPDDFESHGPTQLERLESEDVWL